MTRKERIDAYYNWLKVNVDKYQWYHRYIAEYSYLTNISFRTLKEYTKILEALNKIHLKDSNNALRGDEFQLTVLFDKPNV